LSRDRTNTSKVSSSSASTKINALLNLGSASFLVSTKIIIVHHIEKKSANLHLMMIICKYVLNNYNYLCICPLIMIKFLGLLLVNKETTAISILQQSTKSYIYLSNDINHTFCKPFWCGVKHLVAPWQCPFADKSFSTKMAHLRPKIQHKQFVN